MATNSLMESWPRKHRITVDEYYRMAEAGLLASDERVELIEGEIIRLDPRTSCCSSKSATARCATTVM